MVPSIRASSAEREEAVTKLQIAFAEGRLDEEEFETRMTSALSARTQDELAQLLADVVPVAALSTSRPGSSSLARDVGNRSLTILGGLERRGRWLVPENYSVVAVLGGVVLDLRAAQFTAPVTTIKIIAVLGGVEIFVPPGIHVEIHGIPFIGGWSNKVSEHDLPPDARTLRLTGVVCIGGVDVKRKGDK